MKFSADFQKIFHPVQRRFSTAEAVQYCGRTASVLRGIASVLRRDSGGCSVLRADSISTAGGSHQCCGGIAEAVQYPAVLNRRHTGYFYLVSVIAYTKSPCKLMLYETSWLINPPTTLKPDKTHNK